jgi:hypothetical protein
LSGIYCVMDAEVRNLLEAITNLLYLIRFVTPADPISALAYVDLADQQAKRLIEVLSKSSPLGSIGSLDPR